MPNRRGELSLLGKHPRILVPVLLGQMARPILSVGDALLTMPGASGHVLALVEIRSGRDDEVFAQEQRQRDMLRWMAGLEYDGDVRRRLNITLRITANVASSIRDSVAENRTTSIVLEWPTVTSPRRHGLTDLAHQLVSDRKTELLFVRSSRRAPDNPIAPRSILAAIRGGPGARSVAFVAAALASASGSVLTLLHVQSHAQHPDRSRREWRSFEDIVSELNTPGTIVTVRRRESPAEGILEEAVRHDLLILGSRAEHERPDLLIGRGMQRMVRHLDAPVIMIRPQGQPVPRTVVRSRAVEHRT